jgi:hypothetical protein
MEVACNMSSIREALNFLNLREAGGNYSSFKKWCNIHGLQVPEVTNYKRTENARIANTIPDELVFVKNSTYSNGKQIKKRMIKNGIEYICSECKMGDEWNGKPITLQLDHINSIHNDNRIENLRFLCPNCHSQTDGFAGRSSQK